MSDLTIHRGATEQIQTFVTPVSLVTGSTIYFMAKRRKTDADAAAVLSYTSDVDGGITVEDSVTGEIITAINPADTRALTNRTTELFYEIEIEKSGDIYHIEDGVLTVEPEVIQRTLP